MTQRSRLPYVAAHGPVGTAHAARCPRRSTRSRARRCATAAMRSSASPPSASATASCSWSASTSPGRPVRRWSSTRAASSCCARRLHHLTVALDDEIPGPGQPTEAVEIPQASLRVLQVGLEQERHLAVGWRAARAGASRSAGRFFLALAFHPASARKRQRLGELGVSRHVTGVEQPGRGLEVVGGQRNRLVHRAYRVAELQPCVPDRVEELMCGRLGIDRRIVQEHEIQVALHAQLTPPVAPDGHERESAAVQVRLPSSTLPDGGEPGVDLGGPCSRERDAGVRRLGQPARSVDRRHGGLGRSSEPATPHRRTTNR